MCACGRLSKAPLVCCPPNLSRRISAQLLNQQLRQRLVFATLSGRTVRIDGIRERDESPGLRDYEANLLRLLEKLTNGCVVEINETGTSLRYKPGFVTGGSGLVHDCGTARSVGYYLEVLVCLGLFGRKALAITLRGVTNSALDPSVDVWRSATLPLVRQLAGLEAGLALKVLKRGAHPGGGGEVHLTVPIVARLPPVTLTDEGMVKRIRGVAYSMRVSPQTSNRLVDGARGVLNALLADVYVFTDHMAGAEAGASPGYGLALVAETTAGRLLSAEAVSPPQLQGREEAALPEAVGRHAAHALLEEVSRGGAVDSEHQGLALLFCALGPEELSKVRLGPLTPHAVRTLRHLKAFFGVTFSVRPEAASRTIFLSCIGAGLRNASRRLT